MTFTAVAITLPECDSKKKSNVVGKKGSALGVPVKIERPILTGTSPVSG
jgi:hypothetical protein